MSGVRAVSTAALVVAIATTGCPLADDACQCVAGQTCCDDKCVDLVSDDANCGSCGHGCDTASAFTCHNKKCVCPLEHIECNGVCTLTKTDKLNCGTCGHRCPAGKTCVDGACVGGSCSSSTRICGGECIDPRSDNGHCGGCGSACAETKGFTCISGQCRCPEDLTECDGECVDLNASVEHCGACNNACRGYECRSGRCGRHGECPPPLAVPSDN